MQRIIRLREVEAKTGLKHSAIYKRIKSGCFPRQVPLGTTAVGWLEQEVDQWIKNCAAERDGGADVR